MRRVDELIQKPMDDLIRPTKAGQDLACHLCERIPSLHMPLGEFLDKVETRYNEIHGQGYKLIHAIVDVLQIPPTEIATLKHHLEQM